MAGKGKKAANSRVENLLKKFSIEELAAEVIEMSLSRVNPSEVIEEVVRLALPLDSRHVALFAARAYQTGNPTGEELKDTVSKLTLLDAMKHKTNVWKCVRLLGDGIPVLRRHHPEQDGDGDMVDEICNALIAAHRRHCLRKEVFGMESEGVVWVLVEGSDGGIFALSTQHSPHAPSHMFYTARPSSQSLQIVVNGLGFDDYKSLVLEGVDVAGMFSMLTAKYSTPTDQLQLAIPYNPPIFSLDTPLNLEALRAQYAESLFTGRCTLQRLYIESTARWKGRLVGDTTSTPGGQPPLFKIMTVVSSKDKNHTVEDVLKHMMRIGMLRMPPPQYVQRLAVDPPPTNRIRLQEEDDQQS